MSDLARSAKYPCPICREWVYGTARGMHDAFTGAMHVCRTAPATEPAEDVPLWCTAAMECAICNREWVATYPADAPRLECPGCGYMNHAPEPRA